MSLGRHCAVVDFGGYGVGNRNSVSKAPVIISGFVGKGRARVRNGDGLNPANGGIWADASISTIRIV